MIIFARQETTSLILQLEYPDMQLFKDGVAEYLQINFSGNVYDSFYGPSHPLMNRTISVGYLEGCERTPRASNFADICSTIARYALYAYLLLGLISILLKQNEAYVTSFVTTVQLIAALSLFKSYTPPDLVPFLQALSVTLYPAAGLYEAIG